MQQFPSIQKLDTAILYALELVSSVSVLLLAFGLIASMVNVLTKGSILSHNDIMQEAYAWTQCIGIDASIPGAIMRTLHFYRQREWTKAGVYTLLSLLLLFTAAIVSNIESVQQTLNISLDSAYGYAPISIEGLIWVRSIVVVLLVVAHAVKHAQIETASPHVEQIQQDIPQPVPEIEGPEQTTVTPLEGEDIKQLPSPQEKNAFERVKVYVAEHPNAKGKEVSQALHISIPTANKWLAKLRNPE